MPTLEQVVESENRIGLINQYNRPRGARKSKMTDLQIANENGSLPTVAAESKEQPSITDVKLYEVSVVADVQMSLSGTVNVYAVGDDEAIAKVQAQIEDETLDGELEMEDPDSGNSMPYGDVKHCYNVEFEIDAVEVIEDNVDPFNVLEADVKELEAHISWNTDALAKHKAFLQSLLNEADNEQAVAA